MHFELRGLRPCVAVRSSKCIYFFGSLFLLLCRWKEIEYAELSEVGIYCNTGLCARIVFLSNVHRACLNAATAPLTFWRAGCHSACHRSRQSCWPRPSWKGTYAADYCAQGCILGGESLAASCTVGYAAVGHGHCDVRCGMCGSAGCLCRAQPASCSCGLMDKAPPS